MDWRGGWLAWRRAAPGAAGITLLAALVAWVEGQVVWGLTQALEAATAGRVPSLGLGDLRAEGWTGALLALSALIVVRWFGALALAWGSAAVVGSHRVALRRSLVDAWLSARPERALATAEGEIEVLVVQGVNWSARGLRALLQAFKGVVGAAVLLVAAAQVSLPATLLVLATGGAGVLLLRPLALEARRAALAQKRALASLGEVVSSLERLRPEVAAFGVAAPMLAWATEHDAEVERLDVRAVRLRLLAPALFLQGALLGLLGLVALGGERASWLITSLGALALLFRALRSLQRLQGQLHSLREAMAWVERVQAERQALEQAAATGGTTPLPELNALTAVGLGLTHADGTVALESVDLQLTRGECVALVGPSGAGKSTLVDLLLRLRSPTRGEILVEGRAAEAYREVDWRRRVAAVAQRPALLQGTVLENIDFLRGLPVEACREAAFRAALLDPVEGAGADRPVGARGDELSGGQRQRVALARALAGRPDLLVLDEPTSALDAATERQVLATLREEAQRAMVVVVAHRPAVLDVCTRVLVLEAGRVVADGPIGQVQHPFLDRLGGRSAAEGQLGSDGDTAG